MPRRPLTVAVAMAAATTLGAGAASAAWMVSGTGTGSAQAAQLATPTATGSSSQETAVTVTWTAPSNGSAQAAATYEVAGAGTCSALATAGSCTVTGLVDGQKHSFTIKATKGSWATPTASFTGQTTSAGEAPSITTSSVPDGTVGTAYSQQLTATGSPAPSWALRGGDLLPAGLTLSPAGLISGTPTAAGTSTFAVQASNSVGTVSRQLQITIGQAPPSATTYQVSLSGQGVVHNDQQWRARLTVTVTDDLDGPLSGYGVSGSWSNGGGSVTCTTDAAGTCMVLSGNLSQSRDSSSTFTTTSVTRPSGSTLTLHSSSDSTTSSMRP